MEGLLRGARHLTSDNIGALQQQAQETVTRTCSLIIGRTGIFIKY